MFSQELVEAAAKSNMPAHVTLRDLASNGGHPLREEAQPLGQLARSDHSIAIHLEHEVSKLRLATLKRSFGLRRPEPLNHPDLLSVPADKHDLVDLSLFNRGSGGLAIGESFMWNRDIVESAAELAAA